MDGRSVVPLLVPPDADTVPPSVRRHLAHTAAPPPRTTSFHEYYNQVPSVRMCMRHIHVRMCMRCMCMQLLGMHL